MHFYHQSDLGCGKTIIGSPGKKLVIFSGISGLSYGESLTTTAYLCKWNLDLNFLSQAVIWLHQMGVLGQLWCYNYSTR